MHPPAITLDRRLGLVPLHTSDRYVRTHYIAVYMAHDYHGDVAAPTALCWIADTEIDIWMAPLH